MPEFKVEAVELVEAAGGNIAQVAKELGIYDSTLGNWVRQAREQATGAPTAEERAEIHELRRSWSAPAGSGTSWQQQWPSSRGPRGSASDRDVLVHR